MNKIVVFLLFLSAVVPSCTKHEKSVALQPGTEAYELAQALASKDPYLDPDKNNVFISTKHFDVTTGDVIKNLEANFGNKLERLRGLNAEQLKGTLDKSAENLAERKLLLLEAKKAKTMPSKAEIDSVLNLQYTRAGGEERFLKLLGENGVSIDHVTNQVKEGLMIQRFLESKLAEETEVSEEEIQEAYQEDKTASVRHILLSTTGKSDSAKLDIRRKMEKILAQARQGEDFAELAKKYSEDPGSKNNGGLYEDFGRGKMVKPFEEASFTVPIGKISDIVETSYGFHIIKVVDRKKDTRPLEEARPQIETQLRRQKYSKVYQEFMTELKEAAGYKLVKS